MHHLQAIVVHGGAGAAKSAQDGCLAAAQAGMAALRDSANALNAAVAAVVVLEDDPRFNAGTGSVPRLDGVTIEMDAAVMDSGDRLGAVAGLRLVRNPVLVARAVCDTPHHLLCGEGAQRFARQLGQPCHDAPASQVRQRFAPGATQLDGAPQPLPGGCDTVGAVVRDALGRFAVAGSTGGASPAMNGRVGDTPLIGSGFYAGPAGAVAATGVGEHIMRHLLAHTVYQWLADGMPLAAALRRGVALFPPQVDIGLIAVTRTEAGSDSNRHMPWAQLTGSR